MNILHIRPYLEIGGASEYIIRLSQGLAERNHHLVVACGGGEWRSRVCPFATLYDQVSLSPSTVTNLATAVWRIAQIVRREKIDLINTHHRFAALASKIVSGIMDAPVVSTMHEMKLDKQRLTGLGFGRRVITLSTAVKQHIVQTYHLQAERIAVIPIGVKIRSPLSTERQATLLKEIGLNRHAPIIGCIGRLEPEKGQTYLLQAMVEVLRAYPSTQLALVGDGQDRAMLETTAASLGLTPNLFFLGFRDDVSDLIDLFDFTVMPSVSEGFGLALLESLAQKKAVVATAVGGIPEIVKNGHNGLLVPPGNAAALSQAIIKLLENPALAQQLGQTGQQDMTHTLSVETMVTQTERVYQAALRQVGYGCG